MTRPTAIDKRPPAFRVLDLHATLAFKTIASISYNIDRESAYDEHPKRIGWIDIHYPCEGPTKAQIRIVISQDYFEASRMNTIVSTVLNAQNIPRDSRYEAEFVFQPVPVV